MGPRNARRCAAILRGAVCLAVLLCEDDEAVRELATRVLAEHGCRVLPAALPSRALELAEAVQRLRPDVPVLYVSGYTADVIAHHGMLSAGAELLHKPFCVPDLLARVRALLDRSAAAQGTTTSP